jgi:uncharacterized membrane protein
MTKSEFILRLSDALAKRGVPEAADIVAEYEAHFAFKTADGFREEEIAQKLGDPVTLAAQFAEGAPEKASGGKKVLTAVGLGFLDLFAGATLALIWAWEVVMGALSLAGATLAVCLIGDLNISGWIPEMPYWCGAVFALSFAALAVLTAVGCVYFGAFAAQLPRAYGRFHKNAMRAASGKPRLPSVSAAPRLSARANRRMRSTALLSLVAFGVCALLGMAVSMISAQALGFWHAWNWFV